VLPPCGDEKRASYNSLARIAGALCSAGAAVLRFDPFGTGDSAGESAEFSISTLRRDAAAARDELARLVPDAPLVLLGARLGGSAALLDAGELGAARVSAVAPIVSGATWLRQQRGRRQLRRSMVRKEMAALGAEASSAEEELPAGTAEDLDGLPISPDFVREMEALDLAAESRPGTAAGPHALIVQVSPRKTPLPEVDRAAGNFAAEVCCLHLEPFWQPLESPDVAPLAERLTAFLPGGEA
jgi:pimeloyl-ACP methyl ester carboxylesterase